MKKCIAPNQFLRSRTRKGPRLRREDPPPGWGGYRGGVLLSMAVRRSCARLVSSRAGAFAGLALCWCWRRWLAVPGLCMAGGAGGPLPAFAHGRARLLGSLALVLALFIGWRLRPAPGRYAPPPVSYPSRHTTHAATAGPSSGEGLPIVPPRPGSAIAGRPAEKRPRPAAEGIYRARSRLLVSYANMPPIVPQPVQSAQKTATDFFVQK